MRTYDLGATRVHKRARTPHWDVAHGIQFVTFHLADAVPASVRAQIEAEAEAQRAFIRSSGRTPTFAEERGIEEFIRAKLGAALDDSLGACVLREHGAASIVADAITHFDGQRYELITWSVLPNHVHVVMTQNAPIASVVHSWKSFTAKKINALLGRTGELWEQDYWDHAIRNSCELERTVEYVVNNPIAAGLQNWPFVARYDERLSSLL